MPSEYYADVTHPWGEGYGTIAGTVNGQRRIPGLACFCGSKKWFKLK
ncbi:MAG: hypothetical protein Q7J98_10110 [Kiritimatiellia bacterium]|nr:hypothetical protein [Kiritimatiellia bacterium]